MRHILPALLIVIAATTAACGSTRTGAAATRNTDIITAEELERSGGVGSAYQAIERLRPRFLRVRGPSSIQDPAADRVVVYVDNSRIGYADVLRDMQANEIQEIRYLSASEATSRFGTGHAAGVILVTRK